MRGYTTTTQSTQAGTYSGTTAQQTRYATAQTSYSTGSYTTLSDSGNANVMLEMTKHIGAEHQGERVEPIATDEGFRCPCGFSINLGQHKPL